MSDGMSEAFGSARRKEREAEAKKYIVFYVLRATPKLKKFETLKEAKKFGEKINNIDGQPGSSGFRPCARACTESARLWICAPLSL